MVRQPDNQSIYSPIHIVHRGNTEPNEEVWTSDSGDSNSLLATVDRIPGDNSWPRCCLSIVTPEESRHFPTPLPSDCVH